MAVAVAWQRSRRGNLRAADLYALGAFSMCALLLGSKGFSSQYLLWLLPLLVLVWPNRIGMLYVLAFTAYVLLYYAYWFPDMFGHVFLQAAAEDQLAHSAWLSAGIRTLLLALVELHLFTAVFWPFPNRLTNRVQPCLVSRARQLRRST
jgi:hypothetical protein